MQLVRSRPEERPALRRGVVEAVRLEPASDLLAERTALQVEAVSRQGADRPVVHRGLGHRGHLGGSQAGRRDRAARPAAVCRVVLQAGLAASAAVERQGAAGEQQDVRQAAEAVPVGLPEAAAAVQDALQAEVAELVAPPVVAEEPVAPQGAAEAPDAQRAVVAEAVPGAQPEAAAQASPQAAAEVSSACSGLRPAGPGQAGSNGLARWQPVAAPTQRQE